MLRREEGDMQVELQKSSLFLCLFLIDPVNSQIYSKNASLFSNNPVYSQF